MGFDAMMHISERLGLVRDVTSRWAFACVSLLFYCCNGLCKLIPGRHDNSSQTAPVLHALPSSLKPEHGRFSME